jgi:serine racemase
MYSIKYQDVVKAADRIRKAGGYVTPVLTSCSLNQMLPGRQQVFFKAECLQRTGSFKFRGAANAILSLLEEDTREESCLHVVSHSAGNHAQGLACVMQSLSAGPKKLETTIFMPRGAPHAKKSAVTETYGANVVLTEDDDPATRVREASRFVNRINNNSSSQQRAVLIHPFENIHVMAGQGTVALEMAQQVPNLDAVIIPVGGGALASGCSIVLRHIFGSQIKIILAEPTGYDDTKRSLESGQLVGHDAIINSRYTVADGLKAQLGSMQFPILRDLTDNVMVASDREILNATKLLWERLKVIVEPSAAIGFAILLSEEFQRKYSAEISNVGVILCGGNCDIIDIAKQFER